MVLVFRQVPNMIDCYLLGSKFVIKITLPCLLMVNPLIEKIRRYLVGAKLAFRVWENKTKILKN
jgi:hypothetical protein